MESSDEEARIKVIVLDHVLRKELKPEPGTVIFSSLHNNELEALAALWPGHQIRSSSQAERGTNGEPRDKASKQAGIELTVGPVIVENGISIFVTGVQASGANVVFDCELRKEANSWRVVRVNGGVGDPVPIETSEKLRRLYEERYNHRKQDNTR